MVNPGVAIASRPKPTPALGSNVNRTNAPSVTQKTSKQPARNRHGENIGIPTPAERAPPASNTGHMSTQARTQEQQEAIERRLFEDFSKQAQVEWNSVHNKSGRKLEVLAPFVKIGINISMTVDVAAAINDGICNDIREQQRAAKSTRAASHRQDRRTENESDDEDEQLSEKEQAQRAKNIEAYKQLIQKGVSEGARNDRKTLKKEVPNMIPVVVEKALQALGKDTTKYEFPRITNGVLKSERGINDPQMAMLLISWQHGHRFWIDSRSISDVSIIMEDIKDGTIPPMTSDAVPSFLFDWTKWNQKQILSGNLLGPLFIAAYKCIMTSPSSALEPKIQATRRGNAKIRGIKEVNSRNLAYIATQLRFSLSPLQSYSKKDGHFNSDTFYNWMVEWIDEAPVKWREKTFKKLNAEIFEVEDDDDNNGPSSDSDLTLLQQHMLDYVDSDDENEHNAPTANTSTTNTSTANVLPQTTTANSSTRPDPPSSARPPSPSASDLYEDDDEDNGHGNSSSYQENEDDPFDEDVNGNDDHANKVAPPRHRQSHHLASEGDQLVHSHQHEQENSERSSGKTRRRDDDHGHPRRKRTKRMRVESDNESDAPDSEYQ
ncbi:hypothetical protein F5878DRAFT_713268 [Lentinula raphanica]|uniref:Uncharacterized protein n=1 Tax=Lentinula raphanica TaxID=153919 RepID=A0AA38NZC4_9AGAR|nr:hypothetical protein F5880DRAFT_1731682 [Lentinula raphanica]KAJ3833381.1 hypothetical protein F5878DRAFT_713268 [Lentinula raphanica]